MCLCWSRLIYVVFNVQTFLKILGWVSISIDLWRRSQSFVFNEALSLLRRYRMGFSGL